MNFIIRTVVRSDLPRVIQLIKAHAEYEKACVLNIENIQNLSKLFFDKKELKCLVVEIEKNLVGYATYTKQISTWGASYYLYLDCLYLENEVRRKGIGKVIIEKIKENALALECETMQWQTPVFNKNAIKFYKNLGAISRTKERFVLEF